jgi:hypothetical protein
MPIALVTLAQAKAHLKMDHGLDDSEIQFLIHAASRAVANYVTQELPNVSTWLDSSGNLISDTSSTTDSSNQGLVPEDVQIATLLLVGDLYANKEPTPTDRVDPSFGYAYHAVAIHSFLWPYRLPGIGVPEEVFEEAFDTSDSSSSL